MKLERVGRLLEAISGQADDEAVLFIVGWSQPEITCGELRELLYHYRRAQTRYEIIGPASSEVKS